MRVLHIIHFIWCLHFRDIYSTMDLVTYRVDCAEE